MPSPPARTDFAAADTDPRSLYKLMTAVVVPRPIAWVSTLSADGVVNLAPHSFFTVACADPPIVQFSSVGGKDTLRNVAATGEFVVNMATVPQLREVNDSSARFAAEESEATRLDIAMESSLTLRTPRVAGSPVAIECTLHSTNELGNSTVVLGRVRMVRVDDRVLAADGHPGFGLLEPLARLGRDEWALRPEVVSIPRPGLPEDIA